MRLSARMIATAAFALPVLSAFHLCAQQPTALPARAGEAADSFSSSAADPGSPPAAVPVSFAAPSAGTTKPEFPRVEWFVGYSYLRAVPFDSANRFVWLNGGSTSVAFNLNRYVGLVGDFGAYRNSEIKFTGAYTSTVNVDNPNLGAYSYLFGPRISFRNHERVTPFVQALFGEVHANQVSLNGCTFSCTLLPSQNTFAMTSGGGLDILVRRHIAIRAIQAEYLMTRFDSYTTGASATQNDMRLSSGVVFRFGGGRPPVQAVIPPAPAAPAPKVETPVIPPPLSLSCQADQSAVIAGAVVQVTATPGDTSHDPLTYSWTETGGTISGSGANVTLETTGLAAGRYVVTVHAAGSQDASADCSVDLDVRTPTPLELKLALHSIYFATAQPTVGAPEEGLADSQKQILITLASDFRTYLASNPAARLLLEGHADPRASVEYNQALSERRVGTARQILIGQGVPAGDITTRAFGEEQNLSDDQVRVEVTANPELTPEQRQKLLDNLATIILASNRRVDVMLTTTGQQSIRQYPFNAADSLTLLSQDAPR